MTDKRTTEKLTGKNNPRWKGGIYHDKGYVYIYTPQHPFAIYEKYVAEHRLVMEKHLKRFLLPTELVHHINGIRDDNRIENLQLLQGRGEHMKKHTYNHKGNQNFLGHKHTKKTRKKMSESHRHYQTEDTKRKISEHHRTKAWSKKRRGVI